MHRFKRLAQVAGTSIILIALFALLGVAMTPDWQVEPYTNHISVSSEDTGIAAKGLHTDQEGTYKIKETKRRIQLNDSVTIQAILREPVGAPGKRPACLFIHGAGTGKASEVYADIASAMTSAGIVTLVPDKRLDNYTTFHRDYQVMANDYATSLNILKNSPQVDPQQTGLYAESEGTWITSIMAHDHPDLAFMILTSPPVVSGRSQMAMAASTYMDYIGAPKPMIRDISKLLSMDFSSLGLQYADFPAQRYLSSLTMPLLVNFGTQDISMPIEQGTTMLRDATHKSGNDNVTFRFYPTNHQMRVGAHTSKPGLPLEKHYTHNLENWVNAVASGATANDWQTPMISGSQPHQQYAAPSSLNPGLIRSLPVLALLVALSMVCIIGAGLGGIALSIARSIRRRREHRQQYGQGHPRQGRQSHRQHQQRHLQQQSETLTAAARSYGFSSHLATPLAAAGVVSMMSILAFFIYLLVVASAALSLSNMASALHIGWIGLNILVFVDIILLAWVLVTIWENHRAQRIQAVSSISPSNSTMLVTQGAGHHVVVALSIVGAFLTLVMMAFWGLFSF